jgi:hypothetical protein
MQQLRLLASDGELSPRGATPACSRACPPWAGNGLDAQRRSAAADAYLCAQQPDAMGGAPLNAMLRATRAALAPVG